MLCYFDTPSCAEEIEKITSGKNRERNVSWLFVVEISKTIIPSSVELRLFSYSENWDILHILCLKKLNINLLNIWTSLKKFKAKKIESYKKSVFHVETCERNYVFSSFSNYRNSTGITKNKVPKYSCYYRSYLS